MGKKKERCGKTALPGGGMEFLRLLADNMPDMIWAKDMDKRYIFANKAICRKLLNAKSTDEPMGKTDLYFAERERKTHPEDPQWHTFGELCMDSDEQVMESGQPGRFDEFGNVRGRYLHLDVHKAPIIDENGNMVGTVGSAREVTREKQLERQQKQTMETLRNREQILNDSQKLAKMGSWSMDLDSGHIEWSREMFEVAGMEPCELDFEKASSIIYGGDKKIFDDAFDKAVENKETHADCEHRIQHPDGTVKWVHNRVRIRYDENDQPSRILGIMQDVTWRKNLEDEKLELERHVQHAQKLESLGLLAGGIAHDFNNILMGIIGNADLALEELPPSSPARDYLRRVIEQSNVASDLSNQMLAYSGRGTFKIQPVDLDEIVKRMQNLLETSVSKNVAIKIELQEDPTVLMGDVTQLQQVVMNLVLNASESYGDKSGHILLKTGSKEFDREFLSSTHRSSWEEIRKPPKPGKYVYLSVRDNGCGMDEETLSRVFEPFFSTKFSGRGLGLSAVMGIVRSHDGALHIESTPGHGSRFTAIFPEGEDLRKTTPEEKSLHLDSQQKTVLLVDDEETVREVVVRMLRKAGFSVMTASDGMDALEIFTLNHKDIDCVLLDLTMPHMSGEECFQQMRRIDPTVKVVISSGFTKEDVVRRFTSDRITGFIQKPYRYAELMKKLSETINTEN